MQSVTYCTYCRSPIDLYKQMGAGKFVHADPGPPEYARVVGVECETCNKVHPAPKEEDWFE